MLEVRDIMELIKQEINEIISMPCVVLQEDLTENNNRELVDAKKLIEKVKLEKAEDEQVLKSDLIKIDVSKIYTYNLLITNHKHNEIYDVYKKEIIPQLSCSNIPEILSDVRYDIKVNILFQTNYAQKDLDNVEELFLKIFFSNYKKAIIDMLFYTANRSDNCLKSLMTEVVNVPGEAEKIYIEVEQIPRHLKGVSNLIKKYNEQQIRGVI